MILEDLINEAEQERFNEWMEEVFNDMTHNQPVRAGDRCGHGITWQKKCPHCSALPLNYAFELTPIDFASRAPSPDPTEQVAKALFESVICPPARPWESQTDASRECWLNAARRAITAYLTASAPTPRKQIFP